MKLLFFISFLVINNFCTAQQTVGIHFEKVINWKKIKQKAKKENKLIFIDAYTTWCIPCREMSENIFPQAKVGYFFNKNFINVAVQMDVAKKDNRYVKNWYKDAKMIANEYKIDAYPTYLFLNSDGDLVHLIKGASNNADDFIAKAKEALDPKTQFLNLKKEYEKGKRDSDFLVSLINAAENAHDDSLLVFINTYLKTQSSLLTQQNINFIARGTRHINDTGFFVLLNHPKKVDAVIGKSERIKILSKIVFNEQIYPLLSYDAGIKYRGSMTLYRTDSLKKNIDWSEIENKMRLNYKENISKRIILYAQLQYYQWLKDWSNFNNCLLNYVSNGNEPDLDFINLHAWNFATYCHDKKYLNDAIKWAMILTKDEKHPYYFKTYSRLLYKAGDKNLAVRYMEKCASLLKSPDVSINEAMEKMKTGEEIE